MSAPLEAPKCRTCLQGCSQYHKLDEYVEKDYKIVDMLDGIVPQIHIRLPSLFSYLVCGTCVDKLLNGYKFQQLCIETNKRQHDMLRGDGDTRPADVVAQLENPLTGVESFKIKQELNVDVNYKCEFNLEEISINIKSEDAWKSDDGECGGVEASDRDTDSSNEKLSVLMNRELDKTFSGSELKKPPKKIRRKFGLPCTECGKVFDRLSSLKRHATTVHAKKREFSCAICKYRFATERSYIAHMRIHEKKTNEGTNSNVFTCALCSESFEKTSVLIQHTQTHTKSQNKGTKDIESLEKCQLQLKTDEANPVKPLQEEVLPFRSAKNPQHDKYENSKDVEPNTGSKNELEQPHRKTEFDKEQNSDNVESEDEDYDSTKLKGVVDTGIKEIEMPNIRYLGSGNYLCEVCGKVFDRPHRVKRHSSVHSLERKHACELCTYRFDTSNLLRIHMIQHESETAGNLTTQSPPNRFKCPECPRRFEKLASLSAHRQIHRHNETEANYSCTACQCKFVSVRYLTEHITNKHPEVEKHKCDQCDKSFVLHTHLVEHLNRHKGNKNLVCLICEKEFSSTNTLKEHMRTHSNECSFLCPQCGKTFKSSGNLNQHMKRHFGLKKYQCPECPTRFNCRSDLTKHMSTHRNAKPHPCDVCGSRFTRAYSLQKHKSLHTGERPYKCSQCNMAFTYKGILQRHMRTHTGEKPYKCKFCDRAYAESGDLTKHLRTHVGENTYMCDQCPLAFKYNAELRQHVSEHYRMSHMQEMSEELQQLEKNVNQ